VTGLHNIFLKKVDNNGTILKCGRESGGRCNMEGGIATEQMGEAQ
jgi:hypothetical protein